MAVPKKKINKKKQTCKNSCTSKQQTKLAKTLTSNDSLSAEEPIDSSIQEEQLNLFDQNSVERLILQSLARYKKDILTDDKQQKLNELSHLGIMVEEYLSCFTIIGYSLQGEKVCLFNAPTSKDEGALVDLLRSTFLEIVNNRP